MFWAGRDRVDQIRSLGVQCGQLGIGPAIELSRDCSDDWRAALGDFRVVTVFCAYAGESYIDMAAVDATVGFVPASTRAARERRTLEVSDFAGSLRVPAIACHLGRIPDDRTDSDYLAVRDAVRRICDHAAGHGQTLALETGPEPAEDLLRFLEDTGRGNLKINFDPANMILYGTGDPIEAFKILAPHVVSIHAKDGDLPPRNYPGLLGTERPLGEGSVGIEKFLEAVQQAGYDGTIHVEREIENQAHRLRDIREAILLLRRLT